MKKMTTLFKKDPEDLGRIINELDPNNAWVLTSGIATRKYDGTACAIINGMLYKRYDAKINKKTGEWKSAPPNSIPCQEPDPITGHHPHWTPVTEQDKWHLQAVTDDLPDGTYELCGERIQGNPEKITGHVLIPHGQEILFECNETTINFDWLKEYLINHDIEGIVFHDTESDRMCKLRKGDFGIKR